MLQEEMMLPVGATVQDAYGSQYCIEKLLGKGGFGAVYLVSERDNKQRVFALKEVIDPSPQDRKRLLFERKVLKNLNNQALPRVYHIFESEDHKRVYLLMEYISGKDLEALRKEQPDKRFPVATLLEILDPIVDALIYLHQQEPPILHRDIKPANIIVPSDGGKATLVDFGTAKEYLPENTTSMFRCGTPGYAAIEQYSPNSITDIRTDIYGFGATLYTLLTGVKPVDAVERLMTKKGHDALEPASEVASDIPPFVSQAIQRALSIYYVDRFATMEEFWYALHHDTGTQEELAQRNGKQSSAIKLSDRKKNTRFGKRGLIALFSLLLLILAVGASLLFSYTHAASPHSSPRAALSPTPAAASPTKVTFPYPPIATAYAGTISDIAVARKQTPLYIMQIHQDRQNIFGNFQGLGLVGTFTGTVTPTGTVHFIAIYGAGSLIFDGNIKVGGDIEGTFYAVDRNGQNLEEFGPWYASATSP